MNVRITCNALLACMLAVTAVPASAADALGRLFMTRDQRLALDAERAPGADVLGDANVTATPAAAPLEGQLLVNGIVQRSRGPDVVWVNGVRTGTTSGQVRLQRGPASSSRVMVKDATDGKTVRLKAGQYWEPATGRVADCYGCGPSTQAVPGPAAPAEPAADQP